MRVAIAQWRAMKVHTQLPESQERSTTPMSSNGRAATATAQQLNITPEMLELMMNQTKGTTIVADSDIAYHPGSAILMPENMSLERGVTVLNAKIREQDEPHRFLHTFQYRPDDGAHAAAIVLQRTFGLVVGKKMQLPFGMTSPPEYRTIAIAHDKTMEVPWGLIEIPSLKGAEIQLAATDGEYGPVFIVAVTSPKKHKAKIEKLFADIERELKDNSIYRGQALLGARELRFMDLSKFDPTQIVFSDDVTTQLEGAVYGPLQYTSASRIAGLPSKSAVLLYGPYGTGKSSIGLITAQIAVENGWTFLSARAAKDSLREVLNTAKLYEPAVVFVEDADAHTPKASDKDGVSEILDVFDGIASKSSKLMLVATTNHIEAIPAGMLRPGRFDFVVPIEGLDRNGTERLIHAVVPHGLLADDIDFDAVYAQMTGFQPAWVRAVADRAGKFAIVRSRGELDYKLDTPDLVAAAKGLHSQLELLRAASEGVSEPELHVAFTKLVRESPAGEGHGQGMRLLYGDGSDPSDTAYTVTQPVTAKR